MLRLHLLTLLFGRIFQRYRNVYDFIKVVLGLKNSIVAMLNINTMLVQLYYNVHPQTSTLSLLLLFYLQFP